MTKRKMPVKAATLDFAEDGYEGFHCETWMNMPIAYVRRYSEISTDSDKDEGDELFLRLFPGWDFVDFDGKSIPHTAKGVSLIPADLGTAMMKRRAEAMRNGAMPAPLEKSSSGAPNGLGEASKPLKTS
jgi:hypothetical protein